MTLGISIVHLARLDRTMRVKEWCHFNDIQSQSTFKEMRMTMNNDGDDNS